MYKFKLTQKITYAGMLAAIAVVLSGLKLMTPAINISFFYIPCFLGGIILGPVYGMAVGAVGDSLGTLIRGHAISPLILLANTMIGAIVGIVFNYSYIKNTYMKIIGSAFSVLVIVTYGINTYALTVPPATVYSSYMLALSTRIVSQTPIVAINTALVIFLFLMLDKTILKRYKK